MTGEPYDPGPPRLRELVATVLILVVWGGACEVYRAFDRLFHKQSA